MSKVFTEACAPSFDTPKRSLLPAYRVERSFDLSGPANAGGQEHPQAVTADLGKTGRLDYHLTTPSSQPVPYVVFHVPTFFYNHHNQRRKLCTLHNFRRCIMLFACPSQFSDLEGQRFESSRSHQEQHLMGCCSFCFARILWGSKRRASNSPCPALCVPRGRNAPVGRF